MFLCFSPNVEKDLPLKYPAANDDRIRKKNEKKRQPRIMIEGRAPMSSEEVFNIKEVSDYLKIPVSTIYKLIQEGTIPAIKLGKHWRLKKKDIDRLFVQKPKVNSRQRSGEGSPSRDSADRSDGTLEKRGDPP